LLETPKAAPPQAFWKEMLTVWKRHG